MIENIFSAYISPEIKVMTIETEQAFLAGSIENIDDVNDDQEW